LIEKAIFDDKGNVGKRIRGGACNSSTSIDCGFSTCPVGWLSLRVLMPGCIIAGGADWGGKITMAFHALRAMYWTGWREGVSWRATRRDGPIGNRKNARSD